jgi:hypothetical protein
MTSASWVDLAPVLTPLTLTAALITWANLARRKP